MTYDTPDLVLQAFTRAIDARDADALVALYEADAAFSPEPGARLAGVDALRASFTGLFQISPSLRLRTVSALRAGDLALLENEWVLAGKAPDGTAIEKTGRSAVVLRRGASGWRIAIDRV